MTGTVGWQLPPIIPLTSCSGDWKAYVEVLYEVFTEDFVNSEPTYPGRRWARKRHPVLDGKEATFWHLVSDGSEESERLPNLRRCERIPWPRPMIDALLTPNVRCWRVERHSHQRVLIAVDDFSYVVVLEDRQKYIMLWTAYHVDHSHQRIKFRQEWEAATRANGSWKG